MSVKSFKTGTRSISMLAGNTPEHHVLIAETTVGAGGTASITFSDIPQSYQHLQIRAVLRSARSTTNDDVYLRFNSDTASNYAYHNLTGDGASATSGATTSIPYGYAARNSIPGSTSTASIFGIIILDVLDYASTLKNKTVRSLNGVDQNSSSGIIALTSSLWFATPAAITTLSLFLPASANFVQYSTFQLFGVK